MKNDVKYDILNNYLANFADSRFVRVYSDGCVSVSAYVDKKQINLDGDYDMVYYCVQAIYKESLK